MLLDFILAVCILTLLAQIPICLYVYRGFSKSRIVKPKKPKDPVFMQCHFCKADLPWNTKRTTEGYLACINCKYTKLNQVS